MNELMIPIKDNLPQELQWDLQSMNHFRVHFPFMALFGFSTKDLESRIPANSSRLDAGWLLDGWLAAGYWLAAGWLLAGWLGGWVAGWLAS